MVKYDLYLNGVKISDVIYNEEHRYFELPLIKIFISMGATVEWESDTIANILFNEKNYTLDVLNYTIVEKDDEINLLCPLPGSNYTPCLNFIDGELFVDNSLSSMLLMFELGLDFSWDHDTLVAYLYDNGRLSDNIE